MRKAPKVERPRGLFLFPPGIVFTVRKFSYTMRSVKSTVEDVDVADLKVKFDIKGWLDTQKEGSKGLKNYRYFSTHWNVSIGLISLWANFKRPIQPPYRKVLKEMGMDYSGYLDAYPLLHDLYAKADD